MTRNDQELLFEAYKKVKLNEGFIHKLTKPERRIIQNSLTKYGLDGNGRFGNTSKAIVALSNALGDVGFSLDMVAGDILLGDKGSRLLPFRKNLDTIKIGEEHPEVENSRIYFNWEKLGTDKEGHPVFEVLCYPS